MRTVNIREVAQVVRSKNAGPFRLTLDILFKERSVYEQVKQSGAITAATIAALYRLPPDRVTDFVWFDPGKALKANMTANAEIVLEEHPNALIVPESAVTYDAQKNAFVEIVAAGTKTGRRKVAVKLGVGNGTKIQILDGLKQGDKVILPS